MEKVSDKKKNNNKIEVLKDPFEENKNKLSPAFPKPLPLGRKAGEQKDKAEKSHHDFLKLSQENKYPLGKAIEKKEYTKQEVAIHNQTNDVWIILKGKVYDVTKYLDYHPGGRDKLMLAAGRDGTTLFTQYHPWVNGEYILGKYELGKLKK